MLTEIEATYGSKVYVTTMITKKTHTIINELYWCIRYDISITNHLNTEIILRSSIYDTKRMPFWDDMIISAIEFHGI